MSYEPTTWVTGDIITATKLNNIESGAQSVSSSYTPTTWATGDIITAVKLNNIEQGIANAGGGSSDFSTAKLTVNGSAALDQPISISCINAYDDLGTASAIAEGGIYDVILYKGVAYGVFDTELSVSITGSAEYDGGDLTITGDCTITIS